MQNLEEYQYSNVSQTSNNHQIQQKYSKQDNKLKQQDQLSKYDIKKLNRKKSYIPNALQTLNKIREWRSGHIAPVDTMGCQRLSQVQLGQKIRKYQTLISLMLSVQTTDQITSSTVNKLQKYGLTPQKIAQTSQEQLIKLIYQCNFNRRKAKNIIQVSKRVKQYGMPNNQQDLMKFPGVGVKIAMIYLRVQQGLQNGIGVDTHVHRICNKLQWVNTKNPNQTQQELQKIFNQKQWSDINILLVGFGQILCNAKKPLCHQCPVKDRCPSSSVKQFKSEF